jgi:hypothetical protein
MKRKWQGIENGGVPKNGSERNDVAMKIIMAKSSIEMA